MVSETLTAEAEQVSDSPLQQWADALPNIAWETAADGAVLWFNRWFYEYSGLPPGAGLSWAWAQIYLPEDLPRVEAGWREALAAAREYRTEARLRRHDGAMRWFAISTRPQHDACGQVRCWFGAATDIEDFRQTQAKNFATLQLLEAVTESTDVLISAVDTQFRLTMFNAAYRRVWEQSYGAVPEIGMPLLEAVAKAPGDSAKAEALLGRALRGESFSVIEEFGDPRYQRVMLELRYFPVRDAAGQAVGAARIFFNVTEREQARAREQFLVQLDASLRGIADAAEIQASAAQRLGEFTNADRCAYAEVESDGDSFIITGDYVRELPSAKGRYKVSAFGAAATPGLSRGEVMLVEDCETDARLTEADRRTYRALQMPSIACVSLHRDGRFTAMMALHSRVPRRWRAEEVELLKVVANRCWESLERARAETRLGESERSYRDLLARLPAAVYTCDALGRISFCNKAAVELWGREPELGKDSWCGSWKIYRPDGSELKLEDCPMAVTLKEGRPLRGEAIIIERPDGSRRDVVVYPDPLFDDSGAITGALNMLIDVTERKRAERRDAFLVKLDDATRALADPDDIAFIAVRLLCEHLDADRVSYLEVDDDQNGCHLVRDHAPRLGSLSGSYRLDDYGAAFAQAMRADRIYVLNDLAQSGFSAAECARYRAVGIGAMLKLPLHKDGRLFATIGVYQGRARQWLPEEIKLADAVTNRCWESIERARVTRELHAADRRKDEFIATLAHELRNPLAPLRNALHVLRHARADLAPERLHEMMERQVAQLVRLVDDLLDVSRITRGKIELRSQPLRLAEVLALAVETARPLIEAARHRLESHLPEEALVVRGDAVRLAQVFANLLNNAAKYTEHGGRIELRGRGEGGFAVISVRDSGIGIAPEMRERVFDIFAQVSRSPDQAAGGLGIGLSLVKSLVKLHGGTIEVRSEGLGHGSEFIVRLPLIDTDVRPTAAPAEHSETAVNMARRVLVVDDNRDAADAIAMLLQVIGVDAQVVYRPDEALAALEAYRPTTALLDLGMPELDGYELARRIRAHPQGRELRLVALTGWGQERDRRRSRDAGFDHHLIKPVDLESLEAVLAPPGQELRGGGGRREPGN